MSLYAKYRIVIMLNKSFKDDGTIEIGIDEAGRGSFWGPIMAGAVIIPNETTWTDNTRKLLLELRDSKKISPKKRERIAETIKKIIPHYGIGIVGADEINEKGITWANIEAFRRALYAIPIQNHNECRLIIDGVLSIDTWTELQELIIEGDSKYLSIAAASIIAKVEHDRWIQQYCKDHPDCNDKYDLIHSKGYGTSRHREGLKTHGGHILHRTMYIQNWLPGSLQRSIRKKKIKNDGNGNANRDGDGDGDGGRNRDGDGNEKCLIKFK
jgi:ribonuclease HII